MRAQSSEERSLDGYLKGEAVVLTIEAVLELVRNIGHKVPDPPPPPGRGAVGIQAGDRA
jgi:hypothetical protein